MVFADSADEIEREPSDEDELTVVINPTDDLPDSEANGLQDDVINNEDDDPLPVNSTDDQQKNNSQIYIIVGISVGVIALVATGVVIIVKKKHSF